MQHLDQRLHEAAQAIVTPRMPPAKEIQERGARRRARSRVRASAVLLSIVVTAAIAASRVGDDGGVAVSADDPATTEAATVVVPDLTGHTVSRARETLYELNLVPSVNVGDADFAVAIVIAHEPPAGAVINKRDIVGIRTAVPDPPEEAECSSSRHPRSQGTADGLPTTESISRRTAEMVVRQLQADGDDAFLARWDRWSWRRAAGGGVETVLEPGFHAVRVVFHCSPSPYSINGVPVTEVTGPVDRFVALLERAS